MREAKSMKSGPPSPEFISEKKDTKAIATANSEDNSYAFHGVSFEKVESSATDELKSYSSHGVSFDRVESSTTDEPHGISFDRVESSTTYELRDQPTYSSSDLSTLTIPTQEYHHSSNESKLYNALRLRKFHYVRSLLIPSASIGTNYHPAHTWIINNDNDTYPWRVTILHAAVGFGAPQSIIELIVAASPGSAMCKDHRGRLPLHLAYAMGTSESIKDVIERAFPEAMSTIDGEKIGVGLQGDPAYSCPIQDDTEAAVVESSEPAIITEAIVEPTDNINMVDPTQNINMVYSETTTMALESIEEEYEESNNGMVTMSSKTKKTLQVKSKKPPCSTKAESDRARKACISMMQQCVNTNKKMEEMNQQLQTALEEKEEYRKIIKKLNGRLARMKNGDVRDDVEEENDNEGRDRGMVEEINEKLNETLVLKEQECNSAMKKIEELNAIISNKEAETVLLNQKIDTLENSASECNTGYTKEKEELLHQIKRLESRLDKATDHNASFLKEKQELVAEIQTLKNVNEAQSKQRSQEYELKGELKSTMSALEMEKQDKNREITKLRKVIVSKDEKIADLQEKNSVLIMDNTALTDKFNKMEKKLGSELNKQVAEKTRLQELLASKDKELNTTANYVVKLTHSKSALEKTSSDLNNELTTVKNNFTSVLNEQNNNITSLQESLASKDKELDYANQKISELEQKKTEITNELNKIIKEHSESLVTITSLEEQTATIPDLRKKIEKLTQKTVAMSELRSTLDETTQELTVRQKECDFMTKRLEGIQEEHDTEIDQWQGQVEQLTKSLANLTKRHDKVTKTNASLEQQVQTIPTLEKSLTETGEKLTLLKEEHFSTLEEFSVCKEEYEKTFAKLRKKINYLDDELKMAEDDHDEAVAKISDLDDEVRQLRPLEDKVNTLERTLKTKERECDDAFNSLANLQATVTKLQSTLDAISASHAKLSTSRAQWKRFASVSRLELSSLRNLLHDYVSPVVRDLEKREMQTNAINTDIKMQMSEESDFTRYNNLEYLVETSKHNTTIKEGFVFSTVEDIITKNRLAVQQEEEGDNVKYDKKEEEEMEEEEEEDNAENKAKDGDNQKKKNQKYKKWGLRSGKSKKKLV